MYLNPSLPTPTPTIPLTTVPKARLSVQQSQWKYKEIAELWKWANQTVLHPLVNLKQLNPLDGNKRKQHYSGSERTKLYCIIWLIWNSWILTDIKCQCLKTKHELLFLYHTNRNRYQPPLVHWSGCSEITHMCMISDLIIFGCRPIYRLLRLRL